MPTTLNQDLSADAEAREQASARLIGTRVGKYEIVRIVGKGGMGCVYEAVNTTIRKRVAMKLIDSELAKNEEAYERFHREALAASAIESPHIVQIFDAGKTDDGTPFIVMELLRGVDLGGLLSKAGPLGVEDALHVAIHVLKGLHHAHTAGIVHRDLKPDNVFLVDRDDEPVFVKLLDFGVSKISRETDVPLETLTRQGTVVGTPFYMSPEQAQAFPDVDQRTDIYSVGALVFECLAGRTVHVGNSYEQVIVNICMKDADDVRTHNPDVPDAVATVIKRALARERENRFGSARDMLNALVDAAPESFRNATPSAKLRRVTLGDASNAIAHTPMVISPVPASRVPSGLADTVNFDDSGDDREALRESGVSPKAERVNTLPSDGLAEEAPAGVTAEKPAVSVSAPTVVADGGRRRWALAAAPGVALLLGLALYVSFGGSGPDADATVVDADAPTPMEAPPEEPPEPADKAAPKAKTLADADAVPSGSSADPVPAESVRIADSNDEKPPRAAIPTPPLAEPEAPQNATRRNPPATKQVEPPKAPPPRPPVEQQPQQDNPPKLQLQGVE